MGPSSDVLAKMGDKLSAKEIAIACGVPIIPGCTEPLKDGGRGAGEGPELRLPRHPEGGRRRRRPGMRRCDRPEEVKTAFELVKNEAEKAFGNDDIFMEKYLVEPKHIEVQILADTSTATSIIWASGTAPSSAAIRRWWSSPPPGPCPRSTVEALPDDAVKIAKSVGYVNAGTVEFLVDKSGNHYFIEMNPPHSGGAHRHRDGHRRGHGAGPDPDGRGLSPQPRPEIGLTRQEDVHLDGYAIQCRVTTGGPLQQLRPRHRQDHGLSLPRRLRRPSGRRQRGRGHRYLPLLRLAAGEGHQLGQHLPGRVPQGRPRHQRGPCPGRQDQHPLCHQHPGPSHVPGGQVPHQVHRRDAGAV